MVIHSATFGDRSWEVDELLIEVWETLAQL